MSENRKKPLIYRCPLCYGLGNDTYLREENGNYRCLKCSFTGDSDKIEEFYTDFQKRYKRMNDRITLEEQRKM